MKDLYAEHQQTSNYYQVQHSQKMFHSQLPLQTMNMTHGLKHLTNLDFMNNLYFSEVNLKKSKLELFLKC